MTKRGDVEWAQYTEPFIRAYCERHGYDLVFGDVGFKKPRSSSWTKLLIYRYLSVPFVLFMDLDIIPLPDAPPIHQVLDMDRLNLVRCPLLAKGAGPEAEKSFDLPPGSMLYNCGLMGVPCKFHGMMERAYSITDLNWPWWEQTSVNLGIHTEKLTVNELDARWNANVPEPDIHALKHNYFLHLMGHGDKTPLAKKLAEDIRSVIGPPVLSKLERF